MRPNGRGSIHGIGSLGDEFECEPKGTIAVKGKGAMEVWYLVGRRPRRASVGLGSSDVAGSV